MLYRFRPQVFGLFGKGQGVKRTVGALAVFMVLLLGVAGNAAAQALSEGASFQFDVSGLKSALRKEGFDELYLQQVFSNTNLRVDMNVLRFNIFPSEKPADYSQFLTPEAIQSCKGFLQEQRELLERTEREYGVEKEIITAILLVESRFGKYTGKYRVLDVYGSLVMANTPENALYIYRAFKDQYPNATLGQVQARIERRSEWAFRELVQLLRISQRDGTEALELKGSWAGAFGFAQFLPSSFLNYAVDGNKDLKVDLYDMSDALASIGNYLKKMGWRSGMSPQRQRRLIRTYNTSDIYADTILKIAESIKK